MTDRRGPLLILLAAVLWSAAGIASKFIPWGPLSIACLRGAIGALVLGLANRRFFFKPNKAVWLGALATLSTSVLFMIANKLTTAANAIVLQYLAPAIVILLSALSTGTRPSRRDVMMVAVAMLGIGLFFFDHLGSGALLGDLLAILSSFTFALVFFANRLPGANALQASYLGQLLHVLLFPALFFDRGFSLAEPTVLLVMLLMGALQTGLAYVAFAKGIRRTAAVPASIIAMIEPVLNPLWVFLLMGERPSALALLGAAIVLLATTVYNILLSRDQTRLQEAGVT
ncbi:MAG: DMT family transporter [Christensenellales bacterium]